MKVKIVTTINREQADLVRKILGEAGAGKIGEYSFCSFSVSGEGRFTPSGKAIPNIGETETKNIVSEERIEVECARKDAKQVVEILKKEHPYEEPVIDIYELLDVDDL